MTFLQLVNRVLRRLRESTVAASNESDYSRLVADFVADIHQEVCESDDWASFEHTINLPVVAAQREYNLGALTTASGDVVAPDRVTTDQSILLGEANAPQAWLYDDANDVTGQPLTRLSNEALESKYRLDTSQTEADPVFFSLLQHDDNEGYILRLWPTPSASRILRIRFYTPEPELATDSTDDATVIRAPVRPIFLGALAMCLNERGEEIGEPGNVAERRYLEALVSARETNAERKGRTNSYEFYRD